MLELLHNLGKVQATAGFGIFIGGYYNPAINDAQKYTYSTDAVVMNTALVSAHRSGIAGTGNYTVAVLKGGAIPGIGVVGNSDKYTYASETHVGTTGINPRFGVTAVGPDAFGIFAAGWATARTNNSYKHIYATDALSSGTNLGRATYAGAAAGNSTIGIFAGGNDPVASPSPYTNIYAYSNSVVTPGTVLGTSRDAFGAAGTDLIAVFAAGAGWTLTTDVYTYNNNTRLAGTNLGVGRTIVAGAGDSTVGIFGGGNNASPSKYTDRYTYATHTVAPGTLLIMAAQSGGSNLCGLSSTPGGL